VIAASEKKVLVVDPDPEIPRTIAAWLKGENVQVIAAIDGEAGFMRFRKEAPEVIITAVQLEKVVGSVLCQRIKQHPMGKNTKVVITSEKYALSPALGEKAVGMFGADAYLPKPFDRETVTVLLKRLLKGAVDPGPTFAETAKEASHSPPREEEPASPKKSISIDDLPLPPQESISQEGLHQAIHKGNIIHTPLPELVLRLAGLRRTGKLSLERNRILREIYFKDGLIAHVTSALRNENPALMLVEEGVISEKEYFKSLVLMSKEGKGLNEALVAATSLTYEALYSHVKEYKKRTLIACFAWNEGHFEFHPADALPDNAPNFEFKPLSIIYGGIRKHYPLKRLAAPIHQNMDRYAIRTQKFAELIDQLELETDEIKFAMMANGTRRLRDLVAHGRDDLTKCYQLLWMLTLTGMIEFSDKPAESAASEFVSRADEETRKKPVPKEVLADIMREYYRIKSSNYFKVLNVDLNAAPRDVERAYERIEQKFHPDNMPDYDLRSLAGKLHEILDKARAARRVLLDERTRREYRHYLEAQRRKRARDETLQAEITFKEGERAMLEGDFTTARRKFEEASKLAPDEPDYYSYLGWAIFQMARDSKTAADIKKAKQNLNKAIAMNPDNDKPYLIMGRIFAGEGNLSMARQHFEKALQVNPDCAPAGKALELLRKEAPADAEPSSPEKKRGGSP